MDIEHQVEKGPDFEPPQASILKVVKRIVGDQVTVGKEAKATFARAAGIFILYVTACANDFVREAKRSTINATDIYQALRELDFEDFVEPLSAYLQHYNDAKGGKKVREPASNKKRKVTDTAEKSEQREEESGHTEESEQPEAEEGGEAEEEGEPEEKEADDGPAREGVEAAVRIDGEGDSEAKE